MSLAVDDDEVVGVAAMSFFRTALDGGVTRLAIPVNVATDPRYRGQGVFSTLERENEAAAAATGAPLTVTFPNGASYPIFVNRLGWIDLPRLRLWARPLRAGAVVRYALGRTGEQGGLRRDPSVRTIRGGLEVRPVERFGPEFDELGRRAAAAYRNHFARDAEYFGWRYLDSPRDYRCFGAYRGAELRGVAVVGHTFKHGVSAGFLADLVTPPGGSDAVRALVARAVDEVRAAPTRSCCSRLPGPSDARSSPPASRRRTSGCASSASRFARAPSSTGGERLALHARRLRLLLMRRQTPIPVKSLECRVRADRSTTTPASVRQIRVQALTRSRAQFATAPSGFVPVSDTE